VAVEVEIADQRHAQPSRRAAARMPAHRAAASAVVDGDAHELGARLGEARTCATVAATSAVSVLVIDWTTIGAPPPTATLPTFHLPRAAARDFGAFHRHFTVKRATFERVYGPRSSGWPCSVAVTRSALPTTTSSARRAADGNRRAGGRRLRHHGGARGVLHLHPRRAGECQHERRFALGHRGRLRGCARRSPRRARRAPASAAAAEGGGAASDFGASSGFRSGVPLGVGGGAGAGAGCAAGGMMPSGGVGRCAWRENS
jgi:hypothetical protein